MKMTDPTENDSTQNDQGQTDRGTESKPIHEKLAPQTSIRFILVLIGVSALVMLVFRSAVDGNSPARIAVLLISTTVGCFATYAGLFLIANLFSVTTAPIAHALESASELHPPAAGKRVDSDAGDRETT